MSVYALLTTVHQRVDSRIVLKQMRSLCASLPQRFVLIVADGQGDGKLEGGLTVHDLGRPGWGRLARGLIGSMRAFRLLRRIGPRGVHFHDPELIPLGLLLKCLGHQVIYDVHEDVPLQILSKDWIPAFLRLPIAMVLRMLEGLAGRTFDAVIPATPSIATRFPSSKTVLVQNFPIRFEVQARNPLPYGSRPRDFVYVGGVTEIRGATEMVLALGHLPRELGVRLHIAGQFAPQTLREDLAKLLGWGAVVCHGALGRVEVADLFGAVRAGMVLFHPVPNHVNAQPTKMFEYMSAGLPVIASDFPLWRGIIEGAGCGLLVDPTRPDAVAGAMRWILDNPTEAERMGRRGRRAAEDVYNWDREARKLVDLYRSLSND